MGCYRKKYLTHYKIDLAPNTEIHHIDLNPNNNELNNLIPLHRKEHIKAHVSLRKVFKNMLKINKPTLTNNLVSHLIQYNYIKFNPLTKEYEKV